MTMIPLSFLALIPRILLGYGLTELIWNTTKKKYVLIKIFIAGPIGFGFSSLLAFLWIWMGFSLSTYILIEGFIVIGLTIWSLIKYRSYFLQLLRSFLPTRPSSKTWSILLLISCFLFAIELALIALRYPHGRMDAWTQWNVVARFIYLGGSQWQGTFLRQLDHPDYPLFLAMTNAITWSITKKAAIWGPIAFHFSISFFMAGLLFSLINIFKGVKQATIAMVVFVTQPIVAIIGMNQYADALIAYFLLAAGGITVLYISLREKRIALIAGILTGLACWTKNEGMILIISCTMIWLIIALAGDRQGFKNYLIGLAFPVLIVVLFKIYLAPKSDLVSDVGQIIERIQNFERYGLILNQAGRMIWGIGQAPLSIIGLLIIYAIFIGRTKKIPFGTWAIAMIIFLQWAAYFGIYLITPYPLEWHVSKSIDRVLYHTFPLALFWAFICIRTPEELQSSILRVSEHATHH